jgi:hypothetical protein
MRHIAKRPCLEIGLRASEEKAVTLGKSGEFPILLEMQGNIPVPDGSSLSGIIPLCHVTKMIFRAQEELDFLANKSFDNASVQGVTLSVCPAIFSLPGDARFASVGTAPAGETENWKYADQICGLVAAVLYAADIHPAAEPLIAALVTPGFQPAGIAELISPDPDRRNVAQAAAWLMRSNHGRTGSDPFGLLGEVLRVLARAGMPEETVARFDKLVRGILNSDLTRRPGSLDDDGDIVLRALTLVIQRGDTAEVLADRINGEKPGPHVFMFAAMLAGMREGLAHLPVEFKAGHASLLGELGAAAEENPADRQRLMEILGRLENIGKAGAGSKDAVGADTHPSPALLTVCKWGQKAFAGKVLVALARMPANWRLVLSDDANLVLQVHHSGTLAETATEIEAARQFIADCARGGRKASRNSRASAPTRDRTDDLLSRVPRDLTLPSSSPEDTEKSGKNP